MFEILYNDLKEEKEYEQLIEKVLKMCFKEEGIEKLKLLVTVILTTPENIKQINKEYRNIDKETDVLSFPMFKKEEIDNILKKSEKENEDILGDIIISVEKVKEQAKEYNHSFQRELSYMIVHGFYHLMGYDHIQKEEKEEMRKKEENILNKLKIERK